MSLYGWTDEAMPSVQRGMGEPAVGRDCAVKRSDLGEF